MRTHLPQLDAVAFADYDARRKTVRYRGRPLPRRCTERFDPLTLTIKPMTETRGVSNKDAETYTV